MVIGVGHNVMMSTSWCGD